MIKMAIMIISVMKLQLVLVDNDNNTTGNNTNKVDNYNVILGNSE